MQTHVEGARLHAKVVILYHIQALHHFEEADSLIGYCHTQTHTSVPHVA